MFRFLLAAFVSAVCTLQAAELKIASLHPLLTDLARQVGGDHVEIIDLLGKNGDPHHFDPAAADLKRADGAQLYLAAGMGLESYLPKLKTILAGKAVVVEVGKTLPALEGSHGGEHDHHHDHEDHDHHHELDPHWWHSIDLFRRATTVVAEAFAAADPANAQTYQKQAAAYRAQLDELERWAKREIAKIPRSKRHLATAHAAFNYFCKDFGFTPHSVQGLNREQMPDAQQLSALVKELNEQQVAAIFPEKESNPKILQSLTQDTGIRLGQPLIADGAGGVGYEEMVRHNVAAVVAGLGY